jgi:hypothetical protein
VAVTVALPLLWRYDERAQRSGEAGAPAQAGAPAVPAASPPSGVVPSGGAPT